MRSGPLLSKVNCLWEVNIRHTLGVPYENPKLSAVALGYVTGEDFASRLERAVNRANGARLIESHAIRDE
jgi:hypothetical protein